jgi:hypothetical protein
MGDLDQKGAGAPPPDSPAEQLDSWKEIALFLKRDVSTVQRWEKLEALPVHRHMHGERGTVYAYKSEIATWWNNRRLKLERADPAPALAAAGPDAIPDVVPEHVPRPLSASAQRAIGAIALAVIVAAILFFVPRWRPELAHRPASRLVSVIEGSLSTKDSSGMRVMAGDVNGDGIGDSVIVMENEGEAGIFFGGKLRTSENFSSDADVLIREEKGHGLRLIGVADMNGDGLQDLIFADDLDEPQSFTDTGPILVLFGRRQWRSKITLPKDADLTISIPVSYNASPHHAANAGHADLNNDGIDDLILTANDYSPPGRASAGAVFVFWGRRTWPARLDISNADVTVWGSVKGEGLNDAAVGDVDGDGKNDLVVFAANNTLWNMRGRRGRVYGFRGRDHFPRFLDAATDYDFRIEGSDPQDHFLQMTLADINGDGLQDIILSASIDLKSGPRRVLVFYGRKEWQRDSPITNADWELASHSSNTQIGQHVLARNLEGDGADDLIVCTTEGTDDQLRVFHGGPDRRGITYTDDSDLMLRAGDASDGICRADSTPAYLDRERVPQILVAAPEATVYGLPHAGKAYMFAPYNPMKIDIRPGGYPNIVTPGSDGVVAVAILPEDGLDSKSVDVSTLRLAGVPPTSSNSCYYGEKKEQVLCVYFESKNIRLKLSDRIAILTGKLKDGTPVYGSDSVLVLPLPLSQPSH